MTPTQREAALRLADALDDGTGLDSPAASAAGLLRELASELQAEPVRECADNDSPWLVCKTCAAVGRCAKQDEPVAWLIVDKDGTLMHAVGWREAAHEHINDAINEHDLAEAAEWKVVPAYAAPQQRTEYSLAETDIYDFAGWLTTRKGTLVVGTSHEAGPMAEAVGEYLRTFPERFAPQQRKPLSEEQIYAAISDQVFWATSKNFIVRVVRAVEAAHGITGGKE